MSRPIVYQVGSLPTKKTFIPLAAKYKSVVWVVLRKSGCLQLFATLVAAQFRSQPRLQTYHIARVLPHDPDAFTQGLEFDKICDNSTGDCKDVFWESTGDSQHFQLQA